MLRGRPKIVHGVTGHLSRLECIFLYDTPDRLGAGEYAELGTYKGRSAVCMAGGMKDNNVDAHLTTVDAYTGQAMCFSDEGTPNYNPGVLRDLFIEKGVGSYVTIIKGQTADAWKKVQHTKFIFLFIDADHSYEACKADFEAWSPLVQSGGEIAFHDSNKETVNRVIEECGWKRYDVETIAVVTKP